MEAIVGTLIAVISILGLAHTFGIGRAMISRFEVARAALGAAQAQMETLSVLPLQHSSLALNSTHSGDFTLHGDPIGTLKWRVEPFDDVSTPSEVYDMRQVTVVVVWGSGADQDSIEVERLFLK